MKKTLWGDAFDTPPSELVIKYCAGRDVLGKEACDQRLIPFDIALNVAHAKMLAKQQIISQEELDALLGGLSEIEQLVAQGSFVLDTAKEDVHSNIEGFLREKLGVEIAGKLHTARSRNDQVATDMRLYVRAQIERFVAEISRYQAVLGEMAAKHMGTVMPGFTHHQHAMHTTLGEVFLSFAAMAKRDILRLQQWNHLHNQSPLGAAASFGTSFDIDRAFVASELGFDKPTESTIDPITNRWEAEADAAYALSIAMNHLSQLAQTLIIFAMPQFNFVKLADEYSTGSSIMPQKKNPDPLEVMKGKSAYIAGQLTALMQLGNSNFIGYNRDSQWSKYIVMDVFDECEHSFDIAAGILQTLKINVEQMHEWSNKGFVGATKLMEALCIEYKLAMRQAKIIIEKAVKYSAGSEHVTQIALAKALNEEGFTLNLPEDFAVKHQLV